jgi:uncharacterized membrane protein YvbJ
MKCNRCGTDNPKGKSVCKKCGAFLYSANPNNRVPLTREQKKERRKAMFKGTTLGCFWSALIIIGMFIVLGIISYVLVRFVIPEDYFADMTTVTSDTSTPGQTTGTTQGG